MRAFVELIPGIIVPVDGIEGILMNKQRLFVDDGHEAQELTSQTLGEQSADVTGLLLESLMQRIADEQQTAALMEGLWRRRGEQAADMQFMAERKQSEAERQASVPPVVGRGFNNNKGPRR